MVLTAPGSAGDQGRLTAATERLGTSPMRNPSERDVHVT